MEQLEMLKEYGYMRDMEISLRNLGDGKKDSLATQSANQIKHLRSSLAELVSIVNIHSKATGNNFAWAELIEANIALNALQRI